MKQLWKELSTATRSILVIWAICIVAFITFFIIDHNKNNATNSIKDPQVAQVYEPSIGTPLPADVQPGNNSTSVNAVVENSGEVAGADTTNPNDNTATDKLIDQNKFTAPTTGIDLNDPVKYWNDQFSFKASLPAHTIILEQGHKISFTSSAHEIYYEISISEKNVDNLEIIKQELSNSPDIISTSYDKFLDKPIITFKTKDDSDGFAILNGNYIYYLIGQKSYFTTFSF